ncbi:M20 family metallopeptidase [Corynebacterium sp.]|uniref:M20 metallopeptidase family protein n=1 Tax=Corynebacterium sp. TaxID=1720 RepID=UPI0026DF027C|nr:amidohydrolase [Corynebacterium sp.]MDO5512005.1 amidohydrolase [Corynebacterium sp.]
MSAQTAPAVPTADIIAWRRHFHRNPELSFQEHETSAFVAAKLEEFGIEVQRPTETSVLGILRGGKGEGKVVALRADMDALPLQEDTGEEFSSVKDGIAHACGHDAHTAMLLGAAKTLADMRAEFAGTVKFIFQHAEEKNPGGAIEMVEAGVVDDVDGIYGIHVMNQKLGTLSVHKGAASTIAGGFFATIQGQGSHGSMPQNGIDPVLVGAQSVVALNTITARSVAPANMNIVNVGRFLSGDAPNVIPDTASLGVSIRSDNDDDYAVMSRRAEEIIDGVCAAHGASAEYQWADAYPVVINNDELCDIAFAAGQKLIGDDAYWGPGTSASEDFSWFAKKVPGCFLFLGAGTEEDGLPYMNHHPKFNINENCLEIGAQIEVQVALDFLAK